MKLFEDKNPLTNLPLDTKIIFCLFYLFIERSGQRHLYREYNINKTTIDAHLHMLVYLFHFTMYKEYNVTLDKYPTNFFMYYANGEFSTFKHINELNLTFEDIYKKIEHEHSDTGNQLALINIIKDVSEKIFMRYFLTHFPFSIDELCGGAKLKSFHLITPRQMDLDSRRVVSVIDKEYFIKYQHPQTNNTLYGKIKKLYHKICAYRPSNPSGRNYYLTGGID